MTFNPKAKPFSQFPMDAGIGDQSKQCLDWMVTQINQLVGQANTPPNAGLDSLNPNSISPTNAQIQSAGSRTSSLTSPLKFVVTTTTVAFYWDGTNGSEAFKIYRDDNSIYGPSISGSPQKVAGLVNATLYYFYPYFDESVNQIKFVNLPGVSVGTPAIAFTSQNLLAAQQQILRGRIPIALLLATTGVTTGGANGSGGTGGGGAGAGGGGKYGF